METKKHKREYEKIKKENNPFFKLKKNISRLINKELKLNNSSKNGHSLINYLPYSIDELKIYLEGLFSHPDNLTMGGETWMTWQNQGKYYSKDYDYIDDTKKYLKDYAKAKWQLDHIIPQSDLPYTSMEDENFKKCWALENLRPLRADINYMDGANKTRHKR